MYSWGTEGFRLFERSRQPGDIVPNQLLEYMKECLCKALQGLKMTGLKNAIDEAHIQKPS